MDYDKLLKKAREALPEAIHSAERFEIPKVMGHIQGNRTVISNFHQIADVLHRPPEHLLKYVLKQLATPGDLKRAAVLIGSKTPASRINNTVRQYAKEFVFCIECGKPDTKLDKEGNVTFMTCQACGAKHPVKAKI
jgi:translation initiation factor 2 subunit 2